ncbi:MAG: hypothetical protein N2688_14565 [Burkholderiaceae bacterium]|nr:hypothetical protein [Burkholderiaceae bacterium]
MKANVITPLLAGILSAGVGIALAQGVSERPAEASHKQGTAAKEARGPFKIEVEGRGAAPKGKPEAPQEGADARATSKAKQASGQNAAGYLK